MKQSRENVLENENRHPDCDGDRTDKTAAGGDLCALNESIGRRTAENSQLQQRLMENINQTRLYGDTETRRAERAEVVSHLNNLASESIGQSFNDLSG